MREAGRILEQQEALSRAKVAVTINNTPVTWNTLMYCLIATVGIINSFLIAKYIQRCIKQEPNTTTAKEEIPMQPTRTTEAELEEVQNQLASQGEKLDSLLQAARELDPFSRLDTLSMVSPTTSRTQQGPRQSRRSRRGSHAPQRPVLSYAIVPTVLDE